MTEADDVEPLIVEWYRVDPSPRLVRTLVIAAAVLLCGCLLVSSAWMPLRAPVPARIALGVLGALLCVSGPLWAILGLQRVLAEDAYVTLRTDALVLHAVGGTRGSRQLPWDELVDATHVDGRVVLELRNDEPVVLGERFAGIDGLALSRRIAHVRRRALMGLLR